MSREPARRASGREEGLQREGLGPKSRGREKEGKEAGECGGKELGHRGRGEAGLAVGGMEPLVLSSLPWLSKPRANVVRPLGLLWAELGVQRDGGQPSWPSGFLPSTPLLSGPSPQRRPAVFSLDRPQPQATCLSRLLRVSLAPACCPQGLGGGKEGQGAPTGQSTTSRPCLRACRLPGPYLHTIVLLVPAALAPCVGEKVEGQQHQAGHQGPQSQEEQHCGQSGPSRPGQPQGPPAAAPPPSLAAGAASRGLRGRGSPLLSKPRT